MKQFLTSLIGQAFGAERRFSLGRTSARRVRPELEALESRETPSSILFSSYGPSYGPIEPMPSGWHKDSDGTRVKGY
jgi:hypothetical protein